MNERANKHPGCYGQMFPDFEHLRHNEPTEGKAFQVLVEQIGAGRQRRELQVKLQRWDECVACAEFRPCYELSMAKLALHRALAQC